MDRIATARTEAEARIKAKVLPALTAWYGNVYRSVRFLRKQDNQQHPVDWEEEKRRFLAILAAVMMMAGADMGDALREDWVERGRDYTPDKQRIYDGYELAAEGRLRRTADTTERAARLEIDNWTASDAPLEMLTTRLQRWFGEMRAQGIADTEAGFMATANAVYLMQQLDLHRWQWVHWGADEPCAALCEPNVGMVFGIHDPMPPGCTHPHCHCYPDPLPN